VLVNQQADSLTYFFAVYLIFRCRGLMKLFCSKEFIAIPKNRDRKLSFRVPHFVIPNPSLCHSERSEESYYIARGRLREESILFVRDKLREESGCFPKKISQTLRAFEMTDISTRLKSYLYFSALYVSLRHDKMSYNFKMFVYKDINRF